MSRPFKRFISRKPLDECSYRYRVHINNLVSLNRRELLENRNSSHTIDENDSLSTNSSLSSSNDSSAGPNGDNRLMDFIDDHDQIPNVVDNNVANNIIQDGGM